MFLELVYISKVNFGCLGHGLPHLIGQHHLVWAVFLCVILSRTQGLCELLTCVLYELK